MANPLNLYATKVFAEQPLALWTLDDKADYISFLSESDQNLNNWSNTGIDNIVDATDGNVFTVVPPLIPFPEIFSNGIIGASNNEGLVTFTSPFQIQPSDINQEQETFSFGLYTYTFSRIVNLRLGFRYTDPETSEIFEVIKSAAISTTLAWAMVSETFKLPESFENLELIMEMSYRDEQAPFEFVVNAITAGQWAEEFQLKSFGTNLINVPSNIGIPATQGLEALPYGLPTNNGYYLAEDNRLVAKNAGLPLVFGSRNSTYIYPKNNSPSLILPGFGFMNRSGQFNRLTAEFWIKIKTKSTDPRRIFGPIGSNDGLYVDGPFFKLKVGDNSGTHFVREWDRPMLVDIKVSPRNATLILNGEEVISFETDPRQYSFPPPSEGGTDLDWLGFYAYDDVPVMQIDCVGIYPYDVPAIVAKRRWVYGQAVQPPADIKGVDSFSSVFVDYPFAKYAKDYEFPSSSKWSAGNIENMITENDYIAPVPHELPQIKFNNKDFNAWIEDIRSYNDSSDTSVDFLPKQPNAPRLTLKPGAQWDETEGHIFFKNLNFLETQTKGFYGLFETKVYSEDPQILFEITNIQNSNTLKIYTQGNVLESGDDTIFTKKDGNRVIVSNVRHGLSTGRFVTSFGSSRVPTGTYPVTVITDNSFFYLVEDSDDIANAEDLDFKFMRDATVYYTLATKEPGGGVREEVFYKTPGQKINQRFFVGIDVPRLTRFRGEEIGSFLGTRQRLLAYIGGGKNFEKTFTGDIHRVGFSTQRNLNKIAHLFNDQGLPVDYSNVFDRYSQASIDAGDVYFGNDPSFWSLILDGGDPYDFPAITSEEHVASYTLLPKKEFGNFVIDIATDSYWEDYLPLSYFAKNVPDGRGNLVSDITYLQFNIDYPFIENIENGKIDTSGSLVKTYVAFQYLQAGANAPSSNFTKKEAPLPNKVVVPGSDWLNTKYEVVSGSIIYPPSGVDKSRLSINLYIEAVVNGINTNPVKIRSVQLSSQVYGARPNKVGTKQGTDLTLFNQIGQYFDYKTSPALSIYKGSTPYLYNTKNSGIELKVDYSNSNGKGISMPINSSAAEFFKIGSIQMSLKYGEDLFPEVPVKIFEIDYLNNKIDFYLVADSASRQRGQIYGINSNTGRLQGSMMFFNNGIPVKRPVMYSDEWLVLGITFPAFLSFAETVGAIRFTSPIMFNNVSYFQTNLADDEERFGFRQWFAVRSQLGEPLDWGFWAGKELVGGEAIPIPDAGFTWQEVLFLSTIVREELDASNIYNIFTGTERIVSDSDTPLPVGAYQYKFYLDTEWSSKVVNPV